MSPPASKIGQPGASEAGEIVAAAKTRPKLWLQKPRRSSRWSRPAQHSPALQRRGPRSAHQKSGRIADQTPYAVYARPLRAMMMIDGLSGSGLTCRLSLPARFRHFQPAMIDAIRSLRADR